MSCRHVHEVPTDAQLRQYLLETLFGRIEGYTLNGLSSCANTRYPRMRGKLPVADTVSALLRAGSVIRTRLKADWDADVYRISPDKWIELAS
jgi:hypothetical protein